MTLARCPTCGCLRSHMEPKPQEPNPPSSRDDLKALERSIDDLARLVGKTFKLDPDKIAAYCPLRRTL